MVDGATELIRRAVAAFSAGEDDEFVACLHPDVVIWAHPQLADEVVLDGREHVATWCRQARERWSDVRFGHGELCGHANGVYIELDVITQRGNGGGAWRMPIAVFFRDGLVSEVAPKPDRDAALAALEGR